MTAAAAPGRCLLVDGAPEELASLAGLAPLEAASSRDLAGRLAGAAGSVDLVVVGSLTPSAVARVQEVHRLAPGVAVAVLTPDPAAVRRQASFAPGVPLDLLVAAPDEPGVVPRLRTLRAASAGHRRHAAVLAAVVRRGSAGAGQGTSGPVAVGALLEHAPVAALLTTVAGAVLGWNRRAEELLGLGPAAVGHPVDDVLPGALPAVDAASPGVPAAAPGTPLQVPLAGRMFELGAVRSQTDEGRPVVLLFATDVTAHRAVERERDRLGGHVELLGRVSESLMGPLDVTEPLSRVADVLVPALADWVAIQVGEDGQPQTVVVRHRDPGLVPAGAGGTRVAARYWSTELGRRVADGETLLLPSIRPADLAALVPDRQSRSAVRRLGLASAMAVPIPGRTGVLGSLLLARAPGGAAFDEPELALAIEAGRRTGIALDNARLFAGQHDLATELQRSLLTAPPVLPFADVAVRYVAAGREAQVGGDWYDAFRRRGGDLVVVIGDVVGHDSRAAAAMGQLRGILRGIAFSSPDRPDQVLTRVDDAVDGLELATIASAVVAQLSPTAAGGDAAAVRLRWSNAGHPAPLVLDPGGRARLLEPGSGKADLLLGIDAATARTTEEVSLAAGTTVLLYTDGLVERRGETLDDGLDRLVRAVEAYADQDLGGLCDAVVTSLVPRAADDDVAIVAVRLLPSAPGA